jgi:DNA-binding NarL/FixJ family response regulator/anti-sigma regulatory factor (Ser/Thr protein kinase)
MGRALVIGKDGAVSKALLESTTLGAHEIHRCAASVEALHLARGRAFDVVVTDSETSIAEDLALAEELVHTRPGIRVIALAPEASHDDLVGALRAHVFAFFTPPFDPQEIVDMVATALKASGWHDGIEVISGSPNWFTLRASCHLLTADRLVRFMTEHQTALPDNERDLLLAAFREMLLNAMEHGASFNSEKVVEVTAARTKRAIVYYFRDPGAGFDRQELSHAARTSTPEEVVASAMRRAELGLRPGGFGMLIARQIADELVYNELGNEAILIKHLD